jgi:DNA-binding NtrC family response regulator
VTIVANQTASAIHIARLYDELERTNALLETRVKERTSELGHKLHVAEELLNDAKRRVEGPLLGEGRAVRELREKIERSAASSEPLLIVGPPGSGKEAVARAIHASSARQHGAFIHVYCPHLQPRDRSSLLGLPSGSTIPALPRGGERPPSKLELAGGGTLYLDGVHELAFELQRDLLQVLIAMEESRARGVQWHPDAQVILATSANLALEVEEARFDPDLWRAVSRSPITVPSLQERLEDVPLLVEHFLRKQARQLGKSVQGVTEESMKRLCAYRWPGNVRELEHVLERAVLVASGPLLEIEEELLAEGTSVGRYRLVKRIGSGGMGEVWLGKHAFLARPAAVKLIRAREAEGTPEKRRRDRFQQEAQVTATLKSPHTVQLYDFGVNETGTFYYVMELLSGMDLNEMVKRFGPLPAERVVMLLAQACRSLAEAHELGLVHRDIKPANLFVTSLGPQYDFLKVLDFGMVKAPLGEQSTRLTVEGTAHGTPAFMAPEIALGEGTVDGRADLYSLGCSAYWMLTGRLVFEAPNPTRMIMDHIRTSPRPPSELAEVGIPGALEQVILRCLEKSPDRRPATAQELRGELESVECKLAWTEKRAEDWWRMHASDLLRGREE